MRFSRPVLLGCGVALFVGGYLSWMITKGAGFEVGDEAFWLLQGRAAIRRLPDVAGSLVPLTDLLAGAWSEMTAPLGLYGARMGWAFINTLAAVIVFARLAKLFPVTQAAVAVVASAPIICNQQFMVLEYTNIPWLLLLLFALAFVSSQDPGASQRTAIAWGIAAGLFLGLAVLSRLLVAPAIALPVCAWLFGERRGSLRAVRACYAAAIAMIVVGCAWLWSCGAMPEVIGIFQASRTLGADSASSTRGFYSNWRLLSVYLQNVMVGVEQFGVCALWLAVWLVFTAKAKSRFPRLAALARPILLGLPCLVALIGPKAAPGVLNPRFVSGFPFAVLAFCSLALLHTGRQRPSDRSLAIRQLLLFGITIPVIVMLGSNLGFYRMLSGLWLALPLAIVLIPEVSAACERQFARCAPAGVNDGWHGSAAAYLYSLVVAVCLYSISWGLLKGFAGTAQLAATTRMQHPQLRSIRESSKIATAADEMLAELGKFVHPGDSLLAYPHLEMVYWLSDTVSPLQFMFVHSSPRAIEKALKEAPPSYIVFHDNSGDPLWSYGEAHRAVVDEFLASNQYQAVWSNSRFTIFKQSK